MEEFANSDELKTIMEMVCIIIKDSKDKEEALAKINNLSIMKGKSAG